MIKTSIIVPVYNTEKYLRECFDSIFSQTQKEIEVIAINDGSTDGSLDVLCEIKKEHPDMVIFSQTNQGAGGARNRGMELATGEYIYFMDSDDMIASNTLEVCYKFAKNNNLDIVMFDAQTRGDIPHDNNAYNRTEKIKQQRIVMSGSEFAVRYWMDVFCPCPVLLYTSKQFLTDNNYKFIPKVYYEDDEFYCKVIPAAERVMYIPEALYIRRYRKGSATISMFNLKHAISYLKIINALGEQAHSDKIQSIIHNKQVNMLKKLLDYSQRNGWRGEYDFCNNFLKVAVEVCGHDIDLINDYKDIDVLYQISLFMQGGIISEELKKKIKHRKKIVLKQLFSEIPLKLPGKYVGIYGTGKHTEKFMDEYQEWVSEIKASIIFIKSNITTGMEIYRNYPVYNPENIEMFPLECIIIASSKYEQEMHQTIQQKYGNKFKIILLYTDLHF